MTRSRRTGPTIDDGAGIVERHACLDGVEVALVSAPVGMFAAVLIHPGPDGAPVRQAIGGEHFDRGRTARRMMDMHAAVCAAQHAGFALPFLPHPDTGAPHMPPRRKAEPAVTPAPIPSLSDFDTSALEAELRGRTDRSMLLIDSTNVLLAEADVEQLADRAASLKTKMKLVDDRDIVIEDFDQLRSLAVRRDWRGMLRAIDAELPHELQGLETGIFSAERHASEPALTMVPVAERPFPWGTMRRLPLAWVRVWYTDALSRKPAPHAHPVRLDPKRNELVDAMNVTFRHRDELCAGPGAPRIVGWCWAATGAEPELANAVDRCGYEPEAAAYAIATRQRALEPPPPFAPDADLFG